MDDIRSFLQNMNLPRGDLHLRPDSPTCFQDGALYRVEIPGVECPAALEAVVETARELDLTVHRVTALGGITLMADHEIRAMADLGAAQRVEVCLAVGPRAPYGAPAGCPAAAGAVRGWRLVGMDQVVYAAEDVRRAVELGIRSVLVADEGLLWVLREMKAAGVLPASLALRASARLGACNPAAFWLLEELGAMSCALPPDLPLPSVAAVRVAVDTALDVSVEASEAAGGCVRLYEVPDLVRVAAPVYLSYDVPGAPDGHAGGGYRTDEVIAHCRERVRRARLGQNMLERYLPHARGSARGAEGLALPIHVGV